MQAATLHYKKSFVASNTFKLEYRTNKNLGFLRELISKFKQETEVIKYPHKFKLDLLIT